jgi:LuxR family maltose regulon positive regulatory protein
MMPEAMVVLALASDDPGGELAELIDGAGYGSDLTMGAFVNLLLAQYLGAGPEARARLAAADGLLAQCPSALGLVDFRNRVAGEVGEPLGAPAPDVGLLSERELSVLQYLRSELTLREIAEDLFLSVNTVKTHAGSVYRKLGVSGRHELG